MKIKATMQRFDRPLVDYKGYKLCDPCWNGHHWHNEIITGKDGAPKKTQNKIIDCMGEPCECPCKNLLTERAQSKIINPAFKALFKRDQMVIDTGDDIIQIGPEVHNDE